MGRSISESTKHTLISPRCHCHLDKARCPLCATWVLIVRNNKKHNLKKHILSSRLIGTPDSVHIRILFVVQCFKHKASSRTSFYPIPIKSDVNRGADSTCSGALNHRVLAEFMAWQVQLKSTIVLSGFVESEYKPWQPKDQLKRLRS